MSEKFTMSSQENKTEQEKFDADRDKELGRQLSELNREATENWVKLTKKVDNLMAGLRLDKVISKVDSTGKTSSLAFASTLVSDREGVNSLPFTGQLIFMGINVPYSGVYNKESDSVEEVKFTNPNTGEIFTI